MLLELRRNKREILNLQGKHKKKKKTDTEEFSLLDPNPFDPL